MCAEEESGIFRNEICTGISDYFLLLKNDLFPSFTVLPSTDSPLMNSNLKGSSFQQDLLTPEKLTQSQDCVLCKEVSCLGRLGALVLSFGDPKVLPQVAAKSCKFNFALMTDLFIHSE